MSHPPSRLVRGLSCLATAALALTGVVLLGPVSASAATTEATVSGTDIRPTEVKYRGWHEGFANEIRAYSVSDEGLELGNGAPSQILNGLIEHGDEGIDASNLAALIEAASVEVVSGDVYFQLPVTWAASGWSTLRTAVDDDLTDNLWESSKALGTIAANTPTALDEVLDELQAQTNARYSGFGVLAEAPAVVQSITWNDATYNFAPDATSPVTTTENVSGYDIVGTDASYLGWHEGYKNEARAYSVDADGLHFGDTAPSQMLKGFVKTGAQGVTTSNLGKLITSSAIQVTEGAVHVQVPVSWAGGWSTLRSNLPATDEIQPKLTDDWTTSKDISATATTPLITADQVVKLGDLLDALHAHSNVRYSGFGMLAMDAATVTGLVFNGVLTAFGPHTAVAPTQTEGVNGYDIVGNESVYDVWHEGYTNATRAYSVESDGLHLGVGGTDSQILKGLVEKGQPGDAVSASDLGKLIAGANVEVVSGEIYLQVPVSFYGGWSTLRSEATSDGTFNLGSMWSTSKVIPATAVTGEIAANAVLPLGDLLDALAAQADLRYSGYGVLAIDEAVVASISWANTVTTFAPFVAPGVEHVDNVTVHAIAANESEYLGWHEGYENETRSYTVDADGLHLGLTEGSQILNGLVNTGEAGFPTTAADLGKLLQGASASVTDGEVWFQLAVTFGDTGWATIRPADASTGDVAFDLNDQWVSTRSIGAFNSGTLQDLLDALAAQGTVAYSGFGVLAIAPATVENIVFNGTQYNFVEYVAPAPTDEVTVVGDDIADTEAEYFGWHEGYGPSVAGDHQVLGNGLNFATDGKNSQILNGLVATGAQGIATSAGELGALIEGTSVEVAAGDVYLQVPVSWTGGWATLRPATPSTGTVGYTLNDQWVSSKAIPATAVTTAIAADAAVALGDLLDAVAAQGDLRYSGFGVLALDTAIVESITFDTTVYTFTDTVDLPAGVVAINGTAKVGKTLTAAPTGWGDAELSYQWLRGDVEINGATASKYTLVGSDEGHVITVAVTGQMDGYVPATRTSSTAVVTNDLSPVTGAVVAKDANGFGIDGVTVLLEEGDCATDGAGVWQNTTATSKWSTGGFGISLIPGTYCATVQDVPAGFTAPEPMTVGVTAPSPVWITVWISGQATVPVTGAVVAKDANGIGLNGVEVFLQEGACDADGAGVWLNTTATSRWSVGGFGISLNTGTYCATVQDVPAGFTAPAPVTVTLSAPSPAWITVWIPKAA